MINLTPKFDFNDLLVPPCEISDINSRKDVNVYDENGMLPLFTAPMDTVIDWENFKIFEEQKIYPIIPRTSVTDYKTAYPCWTAISLKTFKEVYGNLDFEFTEKKHILIDIANGHMRDLLQSVEKTKAFYGEKLVLMIGNIANPGTFKILSDAGADFVRVGIGNGAGCLTTQNTGIGYPMASLIYEIRQLNPISSTGAKLVADGGLKDFADICKALALGANYCMVGSILNKTLESAGETFRANVHHTDGYTEPGEKVNQYHQNVKMAFQSGAKFYKKFRGMSTKEVQRAMGNEAIRTSEGVTRMQPVEYTLAGWVDNFKDYLATHMSYVGTRTLEEFTGNVPLISITQNSFLRFKK